METTSQYIRRLLTERNTAVALLRRMARRSSAYRRQMKHRARLYQSAATQVRVLQGMREQAEAQLVYLRGELDRCRFERDTYRASAERAHMRHNGGVL